MSLRDQLRELHEEFLKFAGRFGQCKESSCHSPDVLPCTRHHSGTKNTAAGLNMVTLRANQEFVLAGQDTEPLILSQMGFRTSPKHRPCRPYKPSSREDNRW